VRTVTRSSGGEERLGAFDLSDPPSMDGLRACVHCGICLPQCPTYRVLGEEMDSPRGRIYLVRAAAEGRTPLTPTLAHHLDLCLGCRACETACPSGVPFGQLLEAARGQLERKEVRAHETDRRTLDRVLGLFPHPDRLERLMTPLRLYQRSGLQRVVRNLGLLSPWPRLEGLEALLPTLPPSRSRMLPARIPPRNGRPRGRAWLLIGCVQRFFFGHVNEATARVLAAAGFEVIVPPGQGCCGALHLHAGRIDEFRPMARAMISAVGDDVDVVVTNGAGCGSTLKEYRHWIGGPAAAAFSSRVRDVSEVLAESDLPLRELRAKVTYHDACHLAHGQRVRAQPRRLLQRIPGLTLVELAESDLCCGSAGVYNLVEPEVAGELGRWKAHRIRETEARIVATGNPGCAMQIARHCRAESIDVEVCHPVELLDRALDDGERTGPMEGSPSRR
jgi:glycolate oxidase iron-sulfur subunit